MALSIPPTALGTFQSAISHGTGAFSNSITTVNNSLLVVMVVASLTTATATNFENNLTVSGGGLTYTARAHDRAVYESAFTFGVRIWTAPVTTGATFNLDVDAGALESYAYKVYVAYYTGHDTGSPVGATAAFSEAPVSGGLSGSLSGSPATTSDVIALLGCLVGASGDVNVGSGWTELIDPAYTADSFMEWQTQRRSGSTSTTVEWAGISTASDGAHMVAIEVKEAAGAVASTASVSLAGFLG